MQLPTSAGEFSFFIKVREVTVGDLSVKPSNLFVGIIGVVIAPRREGSFKLKCSCFEIGLKEPDSIKVLASSNYFWVSALMWNFQFVDAHLHILNVELTLSVGNILDLTMAYQIVFSEEIKGSRHGQELWNLAISRMSSLTSARFSLYKLVDAVLVWMHYMKVYKDSLCVLGYFSDGSLKENLAKINYQKHYCRCVKQLSDKVCELEQQLPVEAVAQAHKVTRSEGDSSQYNGWQSEYCPGLLLWGDLLLYLLYILRIVCYAVPWFLYFLYSPCVRIFNRNFAIIKSSCLFSVASSSPQIKSVFSLNFKEVSIKFHVTPAAIDASSKDSMENKFLNYRVYSFVIQSLCLSCVKDFSFKSFLIACGNAGASFSSSSKSPYLDENSETWKGASIADGEKRFLWVEPAPHFSPPKKPLNPADSAGRLNLIILENHIGSMWLDWKKCSMRFAENEMQLLELLFFLFEVKKLLVDPCCQRPNHGMSNINLAIGKLNITADHLLLVFLNQLFDQIQIAHSLSGSKIEKGGTCSSRHEDLFGNTNWVSRLNSLDSDLKTLINHLFYLH